MDSRSVHYFELETDRTVDLLDDACFDALYEAGCDDALIGHYRLDFAREAESLEAALSSAKADAESVAGVRIVAAKIGADDIDFTPSPDGPAVLNAPASAESRAVAI